MDSRFAALRQASKQWEVEDTKLFFLLVTEMTLTFLNRRMETWRELQLP